MVKKKERRKWFAEKVTGGKVWWEECSTKEWLNEPPNSRDIMPLGYRKWVYVRERTGSHEGL